MSRHTRPALARVSDFSAIAAVAASQEMPQHQKYARQIQPKEEPVLLKINEGNVYTFGYPMTHANVKRTLDQLDSIVNRKPFFAGNPTTPDERVRGSLMLRELAQLFSPEETDLYRTRLTQQADFDKYIAQAEAKRAAQEAVVEAFKADPGKSQEQKDHAQAQLNALEATVLQARDMIPTTTIRSYEDFCTYARSRIDERDKRNLATWADTMYYGIPPRLQFDLTVEALQVSGVSMTPTLIVQKLETQINLRAREHDDTWEVYRDDADRRRSNFDLLVDKVMPQLRELQRTTENAFPNDPGLATTSFIQRAQDWLEKPEIRRKSKQVTLLAGDTPASVETGGPARAVRMTHAEETEDVFDNRRQDRELTGLDTTPYKRPRHETAGSPTGTREWMPSPTEGLAARFDNSANIDMLRVTESLRAQVADMRSLVVVPETLREMILSAYHDDWAHRGADIVARRIFSRFWWDGMTSSVHRYVRSCPHCQRAKARRRPKVLCKIFEAYFPGDLHQADIMYLDLSVDGMVGAFVSVDAYSKYPDGKPIPDMKASTLRRCAEQALADHGVVQRYLIDNGSQLIQSEWYNFWKSKGTRIIRAAAFHQSTNGGAERLDRRSSDWSTGFPPAVLHFGRDLTLPGDLRFDPDERQRPTDPTLLNDRLAGLARAAESRAAAVAEHRKRYNKRLLRAHGGKPLRRSFRKGEKVLCWFEGLKRGIHNGWTGPFVVLRELSDGHLDVRRGQSNRRHLRGAPEVAPDA
eukprot:tig00000331_g24155.t1